MNKKRTFFSLLVLFVLFFQIESLRAQQDPVGNAGRTMTSRQSETTFKITIDPRVELMNIILTFTDFPYFGKYSGENYKYYQDVIQFFSPYKNHDAIEKCTSFPYFQDISFPDQMVLYMTDPPKMELKHTPPAEVSKKVIDDILQFVGLINQYATDSQFMKFWEDHKTFYRSIIDRLQNQLPYHEYLKLVNDFFGTQSSEYGCIISPILSGAAFGPTLEINGVRTPFYVTGPDRIEDGKPVFTDKWLRLLIFHEYGHSFINPLCEKHRDLIMTRVSLLQHFNKYDVIKNNYDNWFIVVHEHIARAVENFLLKKAGLKLESQENMKKNLDQGFFLVPAILSKLEYYDSNRKTYPTFEIYFQDILKVFDEVNLKEFGNEKPSSPVADKAGESNQISSEIKSLNEEHVKQIVNNFFKNFNDKNLDALKTACHQNVIVSKNTRDAAFLILKSAMTQLPAIDDYAINKITRENRNIQIKGKFRMGSADSDFTFHLNDEGKFIVIDMFQVNVQKESQ